MLKKIFLITFIIICPFLVKAEKPLYQTEILNWVESIPIYPKIKIDKNNTVEFDSVEGKILVIPFFINHEELSKMKDFYNKFFLELSWLKRIDKNNFVTWEKIIAKYRKKKFFIKKQLNNTWTLNFVVENF